MGDFNVFVGGVSGVFKGLKASHNKGVYNVKNLQKLKEINQRNEVTILNWADKLENEILIGYSNQLVKIFDLTSNTFILQEPRTVGEGPIRGIFRLNSSLVTAVESGVVKVWNEKGTLIETGGPLSRMRHSPHEENIFATGGKENDLKLWDIETGKTTFTAKNVRHDWLELRVPVWVMDLAFLPDSKQVAVATRYGHVRLYDPSTPTRRPVCQVEEKDVSFTCIAPAPRPNHVVVGCAAGNMYLVDLRGKGLLLNKFRGFMGGVRAVACPAVEPYVLSVSLDRHFRIHHLNTKKLLFKEYMQSRLSALLIKSSFTMEDIKEETLEIKEEDEEANKACEDDEEYEQMFNEMEVITDKQVFKKTKKSKKAFEEGYAVESLIEEEIVKKLSKLHNKGKDQEHEVEIGDNKLSKKTKKGKKSNDIVIEDLTEEGYDVKIEDTKLSKKTKEVKKSNSIMSEDLTEKEEDDKVEIKGKKLSKKTRKVKKSNDIAREDLIEEETVNKLNTISSDEEDLEQDSVSGKRTKTKVSSKLKRLKQDDVIVLD